MALAVSAVGSLVATSQAAASPASPPSKTTAATAPDRASAMLAAREGRHRVEVADAGTEYSQLFANPDGSFLFQQSLVPTRVRRAGGWVPLDTTLVRRADGMVAPRATIPDLTLSGGGSKGPLAKMALDGKDLRLVWPGTLPKPTLSGDTATYAEVLPGVDLAVRATATGFSELVMVKNREAAKNPALTRIRFPLTTTGVVARRTAGGGVDATDPNGRVVFSAAAPTMWDSGEEADGGVKDGQAARAAASSAPGRAHAVMPVEFDRSELAVLPDRSLLTAPTTRFPVYIDPAFSAYKQDNAWTTVWSKYPTSSFWQNASTSGDGSDPAKGAAKVGRTRDCSGCGDYIVRTFFQMNTAPVNGKHIIDAKFQIRQKWSWYCDPNPNSGSRKENLWLTGGINSGTTWNTQPSWESLSAATATHAYNSANGCAPPGQVEFDATSAVQRAASYGWSNLTLGLRAADESNVNYWKRFDENPSIAITYNSYPNVPDGLTIDGKPCATGSARPWVKTLTPELRARVSDPDGAANMLTGNFYWWQLGGGRNGTDTVSQSWVSSGAQAITSIPGGRLVDGRTYVWQAQTYDGIDSGQSSVSCEFSVDATPPDTPGQVSSTDYRNDGQFGGGAGVAGSFTFSPPTANPADAVGYAYTLDTGIQPSQASQVAADSTIHQATVSITPPTDGDKTLRVWVKDQAGNYSATPYPYTFKVRAGAGPDALWTFDNSDGADGSGHSNTASFTGGATATTGRGGVGQALSLTSSTPAATTGGPLATKDPSTGAATTVRTDRNFTVAAWTKLGGSGGTTQKVIVSQDGTRTAAFALSYSGPDDRWRFAMAGSDADAPPLYSVLSDAAPKVEVWTYLLATYDSSTHAMRLYVDGTAQAATATVTGGFNATGAVAIGRRIWAGGNTDYFNGVVDDVRIYARVVGTSEREFTNPLNPQTPLIRFPNGPRGITNQPIQVTFSAGGDTNVTSIKYSLYVQTLASTVALPSPGGQVTVSVTPNQPGDVFLFAAAVTVGGRQSDTTAKLMYAAPPSSVSGTVTDQATGAALSGVTVTLQPGSLTITTDTYGSYTFANLTPGTYTISATQGGACGIFATSDLTVDGPTPQDLSLAPHADRFGYTCEARQSAFIPADGTVLALTGDDALEQITLPFPTLYYGHLYTTAWLDTNGVMAFANPGKPHTVDRTSIPSKDEPNTILAPFWADLIVDSSASVRTATTGAAPNRQFIVEWRNVTFYNGLSNRITFEIVINENGDITFNYSGLDNPIEQGNQTVVGIEGQAGVTGLQYTFREPTLTSGLSLAFHYPPIEHPVDVWTLSGQVTSGGAPAANQVVTLGPDGLTTITDANGRYSFTTLVPDAYTVSVTGCSGASSDVQVSGDTTVNLALNQTVDAAGYRCALASQPFTPADAQVVALTGDEATAQVTLPFFFPFYGQTYSAAWLSTNGFLSFVDPAGAHPVDRSALPDTGGPNAAIYPYWDDLVVDASASVRTQTNGTAPNRQFVVEWRNVTLYRDTSKRFSFEAVLSENGQVSVNYSGMDDEIERGQQATVGIENAAGTVGLSSSTNQPVLANNTPVTFHPPSTSSAPVGLWSLDQGNGNDTGTPGGHGLAPSGGATYTSDARLIGRTAATFNGTTAGAATTGPVVKTDRSFAVAAWVRLSNTAPWATAVAVQQNVHASGAVLQHVSGGGPWAFSVITADADNAPIVRAASSQNAVAGVWTHLAGVYDAGSGQIRLYVNGSLAATAGVTISWNSTGPVLVGKEWWNSSYTSSFPGDISDVRVWDRVVGSSEITALAAPTLAGAWDLDEGTGATAADTIGGHPATLNAGAQFIAPGHNNDPGAVHLNGTSGAAATSGPVLNTNQSFTVAAWVKLNSAGKWATAVVQQGAHTSPLDLQYDPGANKWAFTVESADSDSPTLTRIWSTNAAQVGVWTHLVGVYDATAGQIRLYVNGVQNSSASATVTWNATGAMVIGRDWWVTAATSWWPGDIDDVRAYQGALSASDIQTLANS